MTDEGTGEIMTTQTPDPVFRRVDLRELTEAGVLMAANERFFWPLGLSLVVNVDRETGEYSDLHVRQWEWLDGHREGIELAADDDVAPVRRAAFRTWMEERRALLSNDR